MSESDPHDGWPRTIRLPPRQRYSEIGRAGGCDVVLPHASISRRHLRVTRHGDDVEIEDLGSRFGTFVNSKQVRRSPIHDGDAVSFGHGPPYHREGELLIRGSRGMALKLDGVGVKVGRDRWLLRDASVAIKPCEELGQFGQFIGVLGPSGSGKSLLLKCISTQREPDQGVILFDDDHEVWDHLADYHSNLGHVPQEELLYHWLSVDQNIRRAASIRLADCDRRLRKHRCEEALRRVDLLNERTTIAKNLSGGEKKRLSVAVELLRRPRLLVLDEPTSGLDPERQARLLDRLRGLARRGTTVICSIHTLDTIGFFDQLIIIGKRNGEGTIAWSGPPAEALDAFGASDASDLYSRLLHLGPPPSSAQEPTCDEASMHEGIGTGAAGLAQNRNSEDGNRPTGSNRRGRRDLRGSYSGSSESGVQRSSHGLVGAAAPNLGRIGLQLGSVCLTSLLRYRRDGWASILVILQPVVLACLTVLSQQKQSASIHTHFFLVASSVWMGMTLTVREIVSERPLYQRDRLAGLHPYAYLFGRIAASLPPMVLQVAVLYVLASCLANVIPRDPPMPITLQNLAQRRWLPGLSVLWLSALGGMFIGLGLSIVARTEQTALMMQPIAILPQFLLSRVASGEAGRGWLDDKSVFMPIAQLPTYLWGFQVSPMDFIVLIISLPMITRPAAACLDMQVQRVGSLRGVPWETVVGEWTYLFVLLAIHLGVVLLLFRNNEGPLRRR